MFKSLGQLGQKEYGR